MPLSGKRSIIAHGGDGGEVAGRYNLRWFFESQDAIVNLVFGDPNVMPRRADAPAMGPLHDGNLGFVE